MITEQDGFKIGETVIFKDKQVEIESFPDKLTVEINKNLNTFLRLGGLKNYISVPISTISKVNNK